MVVVATSTRLETSPNVTVSCPADVVQMPFGADMVTPVETPPLVHEVYVVEPVEPTVIDRTAGATPRVIVTEPDSAACAALVPTIPATKLAASNTAATPTRPAEHCGRRNFMIEFIVSSQTTPTMSDRMADRRCWSDHEGRFADGRQ